MYTKPRYSLKDMVLWTRIDTLLFLVIASVPVVLYQIIGLKWLHLPWLPIALIADDAKYGDRVLSEQVGQTTHGKQEQGYPHS